MDLVPDIDPLNKWVNHFTKSVDQPMGLNWEGGKGLISVYGVVPTAQPAKGEKPPQPVTETSQVVPENQVLHIADTKKSKKAKTKPLRRKKVVEAKKKKGIKGKGKIVKRQTAKKKQPAKKQAVKKKKKTKNSLKSELTFNSDIFTPDP